MTRRQAREFMMQVFFQMEACNDFNPESKKRYFKNRKLNPQQSYCDALFSSLCSHRKEIDGKLSEASTGWKLSRISKTDLAVLRIAICEFLYLQDIPDAVSINEAVDLAKKYGTAESSRYVNAILGKIVSKGREDV